MQLDSIKATKLELESNSIEDYNKSFKLYLKSAQTLLFLIKTCKNNELKKIELRIIANKLISRAERIKSLLKSDLTKIHKNVCDIGKLPSPFEFITNKQQLKIVCLLFLFWFLFFYFFIKEQQYLVLERSSLIDDTYFEVWKDSNKTITSSR